MQKSNQMEIYPTWPLQQKSSEIVEKLKVESRENWERNLKKKILGYT